MKDALICVRVTKELRSALHRIAERDKRSLSSTIENILYTHIGRRNPQDFMKEKRRYLRKTISAPALVSGPDGVVRAGMVCDISLGGICVRTPGDFPCGAGENFRISVVFTLPKSDAPLAVQCIPRHVRPGRQVHVGASFIDDGWPGYEALRLSLAS
jgi:hypothetical protein